MSQAALCMSILQFEPNLKNLTIQGKDTDLRLSII